MGKRNSSVDVACLVSPSKNLSRDPDPCWAPGRGSTPRWSVHYKSRQHHDEDIDMK